MMTKSRKNLGPKPLVFPMVVFIIGTYDEDGNPNAMNAAWGGVGNDEEIFICLSANHKTCKNFEKTGAFTVGIATKDTVISSDYV
ncbi:MAG: flavin oxidoreductase, partial [Sphaerochaetaceae bacterium]|nr:flavin oxidoreductase [Sphaerochaetaceae bacterium]